MMAPGPMIVALGLLVTALAWFGRSGSASTVAPRERDRYLNSLDGVMRRYGGSAARDPVRLEGDRGTGNGGEATSWRGTGNGGRASTPSASSGKTPAKQQSAVSEIGNNLLELMADGDITAMELDGPSGSYVYSRSRGWLVLDGSSFRPVNSGELPPGIAAKHAGTLAIRAASATGRAVEAEAVEMEGAHVEGDHAEYGYTSGALTGMRAGGARSPGEERARMQADKIVFIVTAVLGGQSR